jgi:hypothetical protein
MSTPQPLPSNLDGYDTAEEAKESPQQEPQPWRSEGAGFGSIIKTERWELP